MDDEHFDGLIRFCTRQPSRRGLLAALTGALLGVLPAARKDDGAFAKNNHKRDAARTRCRKLKQACKSSRSHRCCDRVNRLECDTVGFSGKRRCCYGSQQICSGGAGECCRDLRCGVVPSLSGLRCCGGPGVACTSGNDCCDGTTCVGGFCGNPIPLPPPPCVANGQFCPTGCAQAAPCLGCCSGYCNANLTCDVAP